MKIRLSLLLLASAIALPCGAAHAKTLIIERNNYRAPDPSYRNPNEPYYPDQYYGNSRKRAKAMQQQELQDTEDELIDEILREDDRPLTRADLEEILDRKLDERQVGKKPVQPAAPAEPPSAFGAVGGLGPVGNFNNGGGNGGGGLKPVQSLGGGR